MRKLSPGILRNYRLYTSFGKFSILLAKFQITCEAFSPTLNRTAQDCICLTSHGKVFTNLLRFTANQFRWEWTWKHALCGDGLWGWQLTWQLFWKCSNANFIARIYYGISWSRWLLLAHYFCSLNYQGGSFCLKPHIHWCAVTISATCSRDVFQNNYFDENTSNKRYW